MGCCVVRPLVLLHSGSAADHQHLGQEAMHAAGILQHANTACSVYTHCNVLQAVYTHCNALDVMCQRSVVLSGTPAHSHWLTCSQDHECLKPQADPQDRKVAARIILCQGKVQHTLCCVEKHVPCTAQHSTGVAAAREVLCLHKATHCVCNTLPQAQNQLAHLVWLPL